MIRRIFMVARREFLATVTSKGFILGVLMMPVLLVIVFVIAPRIMGSHGPQVHGMVAVIDTTGEVLPVLRETLDPEAIAARKMEQARREAALRRELSERAGVPDEGEEELDIAPSPVLTIVDHSDDADLQALKSSLVATDGEPEYLAVVVIHGDAVARDSGAEEYGTYDMYVSKNLSGDTESIVHESLREALVATRLGRRGLVQSEVEAQLRVPRPNAILVTAAGERETRRWLTSALPFISGLLLFMGVIAGGQTLMTSTVEEKSSRVVEVLLAAVAPVELMWGKLIAQLGVGLLIVGVYLGSGVLALVQFSMFGLLDPMLIVYLILFYLIAYLVYGAIMLAIGAAVNQIADAQSLLGPVMMLLLLPYILTPMIGQAPNAPLSVAASFIPPINLFAMLARLASDAPPPAWQVVLSMLIGLATAAFTVWFAAKVFRIGLLMHGKPPNFRTMIRWVRMA
jgi:ABC-2 type transport system permease protein